MVKTGKYRGEQANIMAKTGKYRGETGKYHGENRADTQVCPYIPKSQHNLGATIH